MSSALRMDQLGCHRGWSDRDRRVRQPIAESIPVKVRRHGFSSKVQIDYSLCSVCGYPRVPHCQCPECGATAEVASFGPFAKLTRKQIDSLKILSLWGLWGIVLTAFFAMTGPGGDQPFSPRHLLVLLCVIAVTLICFRVSVVWPGSVPPRCVSWLEPVSKASYGVAVLAGAGAVLLWPWRLADDAIYYIVFSVMLAGLVAGTIASREALIRVRRTTPVQFAGGFDPTVRRTTTVLIMVAALTGYHIWGNRDASVMTLFLIPPAAFLNDLRQWVRREIERRGWIDTV